MNHQQSINRVKEVEKAYHDEFYARETKLPPIELDEIERTCLRPYYETGSDWYADNKQAFHEVIHAGGGWNEKHVLDYGCGYGDWAVYYALTGAKKVSGFDISETAIRLGKQRVETSGLSGVVSLAVMDASSLKYPDDTFDIVIGHGVLHHVIKYPGVFEEIHRIMKPGANAYFLEGLADFPPFRLWWKVKGEVPEGDVPIFAREIREKARMFTYVEIQGDTFLYAVKTFFRKAPRTKAARSFLKAVKQSDQFLFRLVPALRKWGSFSYITLTK